MASNSPNYKSKMSKDVQFSKTMTYLLRHGANKEDLEMTQDGYVKLDDLLAHKNLKNASKEELIKIVENCPKQRFSIKAEKDENGNTETLFIRANQGHSINNVDVEMKELNNADKIKECLHGTYYKAWEIIKNEVNL